MAKRKKVLGLPVGKKQSSNLPKAMVAGAGLVVPAFALARRGGDLIGKSKAAAGKGRQVVDVAEKAQKVAEEIGRHSSSVGKVVSGVREISKLSGAGGAPRLSHLIEAHTEVAVPRQVAYDQWTQFEAFPSIMKGAESVQQDGRNKIGWTSKIGPSRRSWQAEIIEQVPDERIVWKSTGGLQLSGAVTFHSLDEALTRILVQMEYDPQGLVEHVGNVLRVQRRRARRDLRLFKHFVELRGEETGAWRGRIAKKESLKAG